MGVLLLLGKIMGSLFSVVAIVIGSAKANPSWHVPAYSPIAEFVTGFFLFFVGVTGLFYIWW
ncbi:hypothetical protein [Microbulbifer aggregans]|uniref:hypothetical protein n=1 Tax=Microbulbifer aggregans TaxID=1769779 RepID=UPI001CFF529C|nr:hypothetical protein [Microbulbifer aggregans]